MFCSCFIQLSLHQSALQASMLCAMFFCSVLWLLHTGFSVTVSTSSCNAMFCGCFIQVSLYRSAPQAAMVCSVVVSYRFLCTSEHLKLQCSVLWLLHTGFPVSVSTSSCNGMFCGCFIHVSLYQSAPQAAMLCSVVASCRFLCISQHLKLECCSLLALYDHKICRKAQASQDCGQTDCWVIVVIFNVMAGYIRVGSSEGWTLPRAPGSHSLDVSNFTEIVIRCTCTATQILWQQQK